MLITTGGALETRKGRTSTVRPSQMLIHGSDDDSASMLRLQRLRLIGIIGERAKTLSQMVWGEAA
jgi:hypothetical protein